tara:strand:- start:651 stop:1598 length:948 start_codon:yes stop_codon:yes gene_type:complete
MSVVNNSLTNEKEIKLSILGASGIGKVHARIFSELGIKIQSILSSSNATGEATIKSLKKLYNIDTNYYTNLDMLINKSKPNAISICTPPNLHYNQIIKVLEQGIPVFCEKPLFWDKTLSLQDLENKLEILFNHHKRNLFVNTSNSNFITSVKKILPKKILVKSFVFKFHTNGKYRKEDIAYDLLPHGLAMLIELVGYKKITKLKEEILDESYKCVFCYGDCNVEFDFMESKLAEKKFYFGINNHKFMRIQRNISDKYQVYIKDLMNNKEIKIEDPFLTHISKFVGFCKSKKIFKDHDQFNDSYYNLKLMGQILLK